MGGQTMRKGLAGIVTASLLLNATTVLAEDITKVVVNGQQIGDGVMVGDRVYVPLRSVGETMGAAVSWDSNTNTAYVSSGKEDAVISVIDHAKDYVVGIIGQDKNAKYAEAIIHGTGFIITEDGDILTNNHVVKDMEKILVVLGDGTGYEATITATDEKSDIALIHINASGLRAANIAAAGELRIGSTVIAIGTPISFSLRNSASVGIVSGMNRSVDSYYRLIQTDATINMGNSGGPLLNLQGQVVGMNTIKYVGTSIEGLGFSISADTLQYVLQQFRSNGRVIRPNLGVEFEENWIAKYDLPSNEGLTIVGFHNNSPAQQQGLQKGDQVLSIDGTKLSNEVDYHEVTKRYQPGQSASFKIKRSGVIQDKTLTFGAGE